MLTHKSLHTAAVFLIAVATSSLPLFAQETSSSLPSQVAANACASPAKKLKGLVCVKTQLDSATPKQVPGTVKEQDGEPIAIEVGPLSPVEACSLTSISSAPSTATIQGSLGKLITGLIGSLGATGAVPPATVTQPASNQYSAELAGPGNQIPPGKPEPESERLLNEAEREEKEAKQDTGVWIRRRWQALDDLAKYASELTIDGRSDPSASKHVSALAKNLRKALEECLAKGDSDPSPEGCSVSDYSREKVGLAESLQKIDSQLTSAANLIKEPSSQDCKAKSGDGWEEERREEISCREKYRKAEAQYQTDLRRLDDDRVELAGLQSDEKTLRSDDATLQKIYTQVEKVALHIEPSSAVGTGPNLVSVEGVGLFENLTFQPTSDSDTTASVTCTDILDNSTTLGPVPVTIKTRKWHPVFSVGALLSLTPHQTLGIVPKPVSDGSCSNSTSNSSSGSGSSSNASSCTSYSVEQTGYDHWQLIPFSYLTFPLPAFQITKTRKVHLGITGGIGFNPYSGVQGIDGFEGFSYVWGKILIHVGIHDGRFETIDPTSGITPGTALPSNFPTTSPVPTRTHFVFHPAFGFSYSF
jgi:hypothetical protein